MNTQTILSLAACLLFASCSKPPSSDEALSATETVAKENRTAGVSEAISSTKQAKQGNSEQEDMAKNPRRKKFEELKSRQIEAAAKTREAIVEHRGEYLEASKIGDEEAMKEVEAKVKPAWDRYYEVSRKVLDELMQFAENGPVDAAGTEALIFIREVSEDQEQKDKALKLLIDNHINSPAIAKLGASLSWFPNQKAVDLLKRLINESPYDSVKAMSMIHLASMYETAQDRQGRMKQYPEMGVSDFVKDFDPEQYDIESIYKAVIKKYGHVEYDGKLCGERAAEALHRLISLAIGQQAPEIEGIDISGKSFRLSDYRGKVVILDFWGFWCPPCRAMFPHMRSLTEQLEDEPFAIIGVNSHRDPDQPIEEAVKGQDIIWRNFKDDSVGQDALISDSWNVSAWPTTYLIDAEGNIRSINPSPEEIDSTITELLSELGRDVTIEWYKDLKKEKTKDEEAEI